MFLNAENNKSEDDVPYVYSTMLLCSTKESKILSETLLNIFLNSYLNIKKLDCKPKIFLLNLQKHLKCF